MNNISINRKIDSQYCQTARSSNITKYKIDNRQIRKMTIVSTMFGIGSVIDHQERDLAQLEDTTNQLSLL